MSQVCKILRWTCAFIISTAIAQTISLLPWATFITAILVIIAYGTGQKQDSMVLRIIAIGLFFGWVKCFVG